MTLRQKIVNRSNGERWLLRWSTSNPDFRLVWVDQLLLGKEVNFGTIYLDTTSLVHPGVPTSVLRAARKILSTSTATQ